MPRNAGVRVDWVGNRDESGNIEINRYCTCREGVDEGIKWLVDAIKHNNIVRPPRIKD